MKTTFYVTCGNYQSNNESFSFKTIEEAESCFNKKMKEIYDSGNKPISKKYDTASWSNNDIALSEENLYRVELEKIVSDGDDIVDNEIINQSENYELSDFY